MMIELSTEAALALRNEIDLLLVTATITETSEVTKVLSPLSGQTAIVRTHIENHTYHLGKLGPFGVAHLQCVMGTRDAGSATLATNEAARCWMPRAVIMVGIAWGNEKKGLHLGDVLVASSVQDFDHAKIAAADTYRSPEVQAGPKLLNRVTNASDWNFKLRDGTMSKPSPGLVLSGDKLIAKAEFRDKLLHEFDRAIGGEMEAYGVAQACRALGLEWVMLKGVCDWGDERKDNSWQPEAAAAAVSLCVSAFRNPSALDGLKGQAILASPTAQGTSLEVRQRTSHAAAHRFDFHGTERKEIFEFLNHQWISKGPCVAILQGIPGSGKSELANSIDSECVVVFDAIPVAPDSDDPSRDLLMELASALQARGIVDLHAEIDKADGGDLLAGLLRVLRRERIVIVVEEFQRLLGESDAVPPLGWQKLIEALKNPARAEGRLLLITNRNVKRQPWSEKCHFAVVKGFAEGEAASFLVKVLKEQDVVAKVPTDRIVELGKRLGGNPRALKTLAQGLHYYDLDDLLSAMPSLEEIGDVNVEADLLDDFERDLIARTIPNLGDEIVMFMRWLSVNRRSVNMTLYQELAKVFPQWKSLRKQLIDRFLLEAPLSGDRMHPLAREVCVARLRLTDSEWKQAHSLSADYHLQAFKTTRASLARNVASSFSELRHHLFESGRIGELYHASARMAKFVLAQIPKTTLTKIPATVESLEEHISLISALPEDSRNPGLEYHLALCLKHRNVGDDHDNALLHVRKAARADSYYAVWLLLIDLEYSINGVEPMRRAMNQALRYLGTGGNASAVYHACAKLLDKAGRVDEAIILLEKAAGIPGMTGVASLVAHCSRLLQRIGKNERAFLLLQTVASKAGVQEVGLVYGHLASTLLQQGQIDDAVELLDRAIQTPGMTKLHSLYLLKADCVAKAKGDQQAINSLCEGFDDARVFDPGPLYCRCAELLVSNFRVEEAIQTMERGIASKAIKDPLRLYHSLAGILEKSGQPDGGVRLLKGAIASRWLRTEPSLYLVCAKLLFHQRKLDQAINILNQGLAEPRLADRNLLIQMKADFTARNGHVDEAINMLRSAATSEPNPHHLESLYRDCAEMMAKSGKLHEAINLLQMGVGSPAIGNKSILYQLCAKLLVKDDRSAEAIDLLKKAIISPGITGTVILYQACAKALVKERRLDEAVELLMGGIRGPKIGNMGSLYQTYAEILIAKGQRDQSIALLREGMIEYPKDQGVKDLHKKVVALRQK